MLEVRSDRKLARVPAGRYGKDSEKLPCGFGKTTPNIRWYVPVVSHPGLNEARSPKLPYPALDSRQIAYFSLRPWLANQHSGFAT